MKIIYCITRSDTLGGAHIHVADISQWMMNKGMDVSIVVGGEGPYCDYISRKKIKYIVSKHLCRPILPLHDLLALKELRKIFNQLKPELISLHSTKAGLLGRMASIGLPAAVLFTAHGWSFTEGISRSKAYIYRNLERFVAPLADKIITVSDYDRNLALTYGVGKQDQLITVHNGMPDVSERSVPGAISLPIRIAMVARLDEPKDHPILFKALSEIKEIEWQLDLIGDGPYEVSLKLLATQLGITDKIRFLGLRHDVAKLLSQAHLFVLTSRWEGFPRSILEAMRSGLPVVASDVGGINESVENERTGFLVTTGDVQMLKERLKILLSDPTLRAKMGRLGRERFENNYRFDIMAKNTLSVYENVLGRSLCVSA